MNKINSEGIKTSKIYAQTVKSNDGVKYLNKNESIEKYSFGETVVPYDWSPDYANAFQQFGTKGYTAQTNGWLSIDGAVKDITSIFINGEIANTFYNDGSYQLFLNVGD